MHDGDRHHQHNTCQAQLHQSRCARTNPGQGSTLTGQHPPSCPAHRLRNCPIGPRGPNLQPSCWGGGGRWGAQAAIAMPHLFTDRHRRAPRTRVTPHSRLGTTRAGGPRDAKGGFPPAARAAPQGSHSKKHDSSNTHTLQLARYAQKLWRLAVTQGRTGACGRAGGGRMGTRTGGALRRGGGARQGRNTAGLVLHTGGRGACDRLLRTLCCEVRCTALR